MRDCVSACTACVQVIQCVHGIYVYQHTQRRMLAAGMARNEVPQSAQNYKVQPTA
jgi:hypothetical protein